MLNICGIKISLFIENNIILPWRKKSISAYIFQLELLTFCAKVTI